MTMADLGWTEGISHDGSLPRDRREVERVLTYWESRPGALDGELTVAGLDLGRITHNEWSNRFLIAVDPVIERSSLVLYGPKFAQLLHLPQQARPSMPIMRQLPRRYADIFLRGCTQAQQEAQPVRLDGEVDRYDGRLEQYRAVFIPIGVKANSLTCFAFGAFNRRTVEMHAAA